MCLALVPFSVLPVSGKAALETDVLHDSARWQALPDTPPVPDDNPQSEAKIELGKALFFEPRLSLTGTVSCNSCHNLAEGGDDSRAVSMGIDGKLGTRNAPTVWNAAFHSVQFWDGRAPSLEEQAKGPIINPVEQGLKDHAVAIRQLKKLPGYMVAFKQVFGEKDPVNIDNAVKAIAAFERTLITPNSPYDRFVQGDETALSRTQKEGMRLFAQKGCMSCHSGSMFNGPPMPLGTGFYQRFPTYAGHEEIKHYQLDEDKGRAQTSGKDAEAHLWKVPSLRNVALTAPYFHNGSVNELSDAVDIMGKTQLNIALSDNEIEIITQFLFALTGERPEIQLPKLPVAMGRSIIE